jgi:hypothetical protein
MLTSPRNPEAVRVINAITVGHTWFFRDTELIDVIEQTMKGFPAGRQIDVWVPGCASGEDVIHSRGGSGPRRGDSSSQGQLSPRDVTPKPRLTSP